VIPSRANFVLATVPLEAHARRLYEALKARGILVRFFDKPGLNDKLRITVGTPAEHGVLFDALDALAAG